MDDDFNELIFGDGDSMRWSPLHLFVKLASTDRRNAALWRGCLDLEIGVAVEGMIRLLERGQLAMFLMMVRMAPDYDALKQMGKSEEECLKAEVIGRIADGIEKWICIDNEEE